MGKREEGCVRGVDSGAVGETDGDAMCGGDFVGTRSGGAEEMAGTAGVSNGAAVGRDRKRSGNNRIRK